MDGRGFRPFSVEQERTELKRPKAASKNFGGGWWMLQVSCVRRGLPCTPGWRSHLNLLAGLEAARQLGEEKKIQIDGAVLGEVNGTACGVAGVPGADARGGREAKAVVAVHSAFRNVPRVQIVQISAPPFKKKRDPCDARRASLAGLLWPARRVR